MPNDGLANGGEILGRQGHGTPSTGLRGSKVVWPIQPEHWYLILRCFDPADLHLPLKGIGREEDHRPLSARRYPHDPRQALVDAMHPQPMQVDARRLSAEFPALRNYPIDLQVSDPCKIHIGIGKYASGAGRHPHPLGNRGPEAQDTPRPSRTVDLDQSSLANSFTVRARNAAQQTKNKSPAPRPAERGDLKSHIRPKRAVKFS